MKRSAIKPGKGWVHVGGPVWDKDGYRLHLDGYLSRKVPKKGTSNTWLLESVAKSHQYPTDTGKLSAWTMEKANGWNRRRGMMAWANQFICTTSN